MHLARQNTADQALGDAPRLDEAVEIDAGIDTHPMEHEDEIFRRQIAGGAWCVRAAAHSTDARVKIANAHFQTDQDVRESRAAGVVHVHRHSFGWHFRSKEIEDIASLPRRTDAYRVADGNLIAAHVEQPYRDGPGSTGIDVPLVGTAPNGRHITTHSHPESSRRSDGVLERRQSLVHGLIDVLLVVRLARGHEHGYLAHTRESCPLETFGVRAERAEGHPFGSLSVPGDFVRVGQLRDPLRRDEARYLDALAAAGAERGDEPKLAMKGNRRPLVLQAVARRNLVNRSVIRKRRTKRGAHGSSIQGSNCRIPPARNSKVPWTAPRGAAYHPNMTGSTGRGEPLNLRGRLSDVYFPALLSGGTESLARRLGERATLDDPLFGQTSGTLALERALKERAAWLTTRGASFANRGLVVGSDREVTEGLLSLTVDGRQVVLPVAVVAEKRREREVDVRLYYSTRAFSQTPAVRQSVLTSEDVVVPPPVATHLDALSRADLGALVASFEHDATLCAPDGTSYGGSSSRPSLRAYFETIVGTGGDAEGGTTLLGSARADDGSACALECAVVRFRGRDVPPQAALVVYERGDSGLLKAARLYGDIG